MRLRTLRTALATSSRALLLGACVAACRAPAAGAGRAEELFGALAVRFGTMRRDSTLEANRVKLIRYALSPSKLFGDTALWTSRDDDLRVLAVSGTLENGEFVLAADAEAKAPSATGDMRSVMALRRVAPSVYRWDTRSEMAAGELRLDDLREGLMFFLGAVGGRAGGELREDARTAMPRSAAAIGRVVSLDSLRSASAGDGSTTVRIVLSFHPEGIAEEFPGFAAYLTRYVAPARYRFALADRDGGRWASVAAGSGRLGVDLRLRDGAIVPLDGPPRAFPDSLELRGDVTMRGPLFSVGASDLVAEVTTVRTGDERGLAVRFRDEPSWHFPLAVRHLIGGALRRPFAGSGSELRLLATRHAGAPTVVAAEVHTEVQEGFIVRWLGRLGSSFLGAVTPDVEREADQLLSRVFGAMRADIQGWRQLTEN